MRRQGSSADLDRHTSPKADLAERWTSASAGTLEAADDLDGRPRREKKGVKGNNTSGAAVSPSGVPKADHVSDQTNTTQL